MGQLYTALVGQEQKRTSALGPMNEAKGRYRRAQTGFYKENNQIYQRKSKRKKNLTKKLLLS